MTLNNFTEAIAAKLSALWPDRKVYVDEIPKDADGQFFVGIIESEQEKHLDRRWKRSIQFEVLYFLKSKENMEFNAWAEAMYDQFETLTVQETEQKTRTIRLTGQKAKSNKNARVYTYRTLLKYLATVSNDFKVVLNNDAYELFIRIRLSGYTQRDALAAVLGQMIPANLVLLLQTAIPQTVLRPASVVGAAMVNMVRHEHQPEGGNQNGTI